MAFLEAAGLDLPRHGSEGIEPVPDPRMSPKAMAGGNLCKFMEILGNLFVPLCSNKSVVTGCCRSVCMTCEAKIGRKLRASPLVGQDLDLECKDVQIRESRRSIEQDKDVRDYTCKECQHATYWCVLWFRKSRCQGFKIFVLRLVSMFRQMDSWLRWIATTLARSIRM